VRGTFLQNQGMMQEYHRTHFNSVEMEAGPYLCAVYEHLFPERYPMNATINLDNDADALYDSASSTTRPTPLIKKQKNQKKTKKKKKKKKIK